MADSYSLADVQSILNKSEVELRYLIVAGQLRAIRQHDGELRFFREDVDRLR